MKTLIMMRGLPASGKTTRAKELLNNYGSGNAKRVSKDDLRAMLDGGVWSGANERFLLGVRDYVVSAALNSGKHVIVDDTNLDPKHEANLRALAAKMGGEFKVIDFSSVPPEECIERDRMRAKYVGERVIRDMYNRYIAPKVEPAAIDASLPDRVVIDVDGTMALMNGRGPFDWGRVGEDRVNPPVAFLVDLLKRTDQISLIVVSGRDECCREATAYWIHNHFGIRAPLFMRPEGDTRDDRLVKREIYEREICGKYNVRFVLDDRDKVVRQWRDLGLPCFQVAPGDF